MFMPTPSPQMKSLPIALAPSSARSSLLAAYNQWSNADFSGCLDELDRVERTLERRELVEAIMLRARVYARLDRPLDAVEVLSAMSPVSHDDADVQCSVRTIRGHALSLAGRYEKALTEMHAAVAYSRKHLVARSAQLEALYMLAFGHWLAGEYDSADMIATQAVESNGDITTARAIALRGWICVGRACYSRALGFFRDALRVYASALARDAGFAASTLHAVAMYELELLDSADRPRYYHGDFPAVSTSTLDAFRLLVHDVDAWRAALSGDEYQAIESSVRMDSLNVSPHWRVFGAATRAMIAEAFGHSTFSRAFAAAGFDDARDTDWNDSPAESRDGLLYLAIATAGHDVERARTMLRTFSRIKKPISPRFFHGKSSLQSATEEFARGVVASRAGDEAVATRHLQSAYDTYAEIGFLRSATEVQLLLGERCTTDGRRHYRAARATIVERFPRSYLARRLRDFAPSLDSDDASALTSAHRSVVNALCNGVTPREIARDRGTTVGTVYNQLKEIYRRTGLRSIQGIVSRYGRSAADR